MFGKAKAMAAKAAKKAQEAKDAAVDKAKDMMAEGTGTAESDLKIIGRLYCQDYKLPNVVVVKEGLLWKIGNASLPTAKWKQFYFLLIAPGFLLWFENEAEAAAFKKSKIVANDLTGNQFLVNTRDFVKATYRYVRLNDGEKCDQSEQVKLADFEAPSDLAWVRSGEIVKARADVIKVRGHRKQWKMQVADFSADDEPTAKSWIEAVKVCASLSQEKDVLAEIASGKRAIPVDAEWKIREAEAARLAAEARLKAAADEAARKKAQKEMQHAVAEAKRIAEMKAKRQAAARLEAETQRLAALALEAQGDSTPDEPYNPYSQSAFGN